MKRTVVCVTAALFLNALVSTAFAGGNANFVLGGRSMTDDNNWKPFESQGLFGVTVDFGRPSWPIHLETGLQASSKRKTISGNDVTGGVQEVLFGVNKTWNAGQGKMHPYIGGGLASVDGSFDSGGVSVHDSTGGVYVHGGVYWRIGRRFNIGFDARALGGTKLTIAGQDLNANYTQIGLVLGWGWPSRK